MTFHLNWQLVRSVDCIRSLCVYYSKWILYKDTTCLSSVFYWTTFIMMYLFCFCFHATEFLKHSRGLPWEGGFPWALWYGKSLRGCLLIGGHMRAAWCSPCQSPGLKWERVFIQRWAILYSLMKALAHEHSLWLVNWLKPRNYGITADGLTIMPTIAFESMIMDKWSQRTFSVGFIIMDLLSWITKLDTNDIPEQK